ncbi:MAG TPA: right-handed parallel beta-helix repeat-containing protein [Streptosporangiaceae bacterium]|nr:right-handed parallel beta-helix repeat-containing protein [Streptosporangiaceae bacterium]
MGKAGRNRTSIRTWLRQPLCWLAVAMAAAVLLSACSFFARPAGNTTFYVSPSGNDSAAGTSPDTAWRTLARASSADLKPGDRLLLRGGSRFAGQLRFGPHDAGDPGQPVQVGSYGSGRATIAATGGTAIVVFDTAGIDLRDLVIVGKQPARASSVGIQLFSDRPAGHRLKHIVIAQVDVSGFGDGISIGAEHPAAGFAGVQITNSALHDNLTAGLSAYGPRFDAAAPAYAHADLRVSHVTVFRNRGDPATTTSNTGNGIVLGSVSGASVRWSTAYRNGGSNGAPHEGPIGIWAYDSTKVVIEHSLSYRNQTASRRDGGGFGLDQNTSESSLQYNLSYDNAGAGYQVYAPNNAHSYGNVVRFNISSGDATQTINAAGIIVAGPVSRATVYHNTVVMGPSAGDWSHPALWLGAVHQVTVRNNIFMMAHPGPVVIALTAIPRSAALLQGNDYFTTARQWSVLWGISRPYDSLSSWRGATGQESTRGKASGLTVNPRLAGPVTNLSASTVTGRANSAGFRLLPGSPVRQAGLNLRAFGIDPGPVDYFGAPLRAGRPDIGAG